MPDEGVPKPISISENKEGIKKAVIVSGFPGIGKTSLLSRAGEYIILDSDSTNFSWADESKIKRHPDWPQNYIDHIKENSNKADIILVSSHDVVRNTLTQASIEFTLVYPSLEMKEEYIQRYRARGSNEKFIELLTANYENWIKELMAQKGCKHVVLQPGQYLSDVISQSRE